MPASPLIKRSEPAPSRARSSALESWARSCARATKGVRSLPASTPLDWAFAHGTSQRCQRASIPLSANSPRSSSSARAVPRTPCTVSEAKIAPAGCRRLDALGDDQRLAVHAAVLGEHLAGVQADAELYGVVGLAPVPARDRALELLRAGDCAPRRLERHHQPVAGVLHEHAALLCHLLVGQRDELAFDRGRRDVAQPLVQRSRPDQVGRQDRDGAFRE